MTFKPVAFLLADLGVTKTHFRPHVSNDNPFSKAHFKTLKYHPPPRTASARFRTPASTARAASLGTVLSLRISATSADAGEASPRDSSGRSARLSADEGGGEESRRRVRRHGGRRMAQTGLGYTPSRRAPPVGVRSQSQGPALSS
jgi:hypothetical protein